MTRYVAYAAALILLLAACGLEGEDQAQVIEEVQYDLLETTTSTTSTTVAESPVFGVLFYWHSAGDSRLRVVPRAREERPSASQTLQQLVIGPLEEDLETNPDLQTLLNETMEPVLTQVEGSTYQIQIQQLAEEALTTEQAAEFVCTATQFDEIDAVTIVGIDDVPFFLSGAGAVAIAGPARASDFGDCQEEPLPGEVEAAEGEEDPDAEGTTTTTE